MKVKLVTILFLLVSIIVMEGGHLFKNLGKDFPGLLEAVEEEVQNEDYEEALVKTGEAQKVFRKVSNWTQFSFELRELGALKHSLANLEGALVARDGAEALVQIYLIRSYWQDLGK
jgi:hypothetical protein